MKKNGKAALVLLAVVMMLLCLCGCSGLEKMRKNQAFAGENGDILWNGATYKALPSDEDFYVQTGGYEDVVCLTEPDVPVLLSRMFAEKELYPSGDGVFLEDIDAYVYYCRQDRYEEVLSRMQGEFVPDLMCYEHPETEDWYILTEEQVAAIELVLQSVEPTVLGDGMYMECDYYIVLEACSQDMLFRRSSATISISDTTYYLHRYVDSQEQVFAVPETYNDIFQEITRAYVEEMAALEAELEKLF